MSKKTAKHLILLIYPCISLCVFIAGYFLFEDWIRLALWGETRPAKIEAVLLKYEDESSDLIHLKDHRIELISEDGSRMEVYATNYDIQRITKAGKSLDLTNGVTAAVGGDISFSQDLKQLVESAKDRTQWFMLRQSRLQERSRVVRVEKYERVLGFTDLPDTVSKFAFTREATLYPVLDKGEAVSKTWESRAVFSYENQEALAERKGDHLLEFERKVDGAVSEETHREFLIHDQPYSVIQYPVFVFEYAGKRHAVLSDLGKHGDPFLAFPIYADAKALFWPDRPEQAILIGSAKPPEHDEKFLNWFSKVSEIYMTRWIYPGMFALVGVVSLVVGGIFISLLVIPVKELPPVPRAEKEETKDEG